MNGNGCRCLLEAMDVYGCRNLVFSSSETLYDNPDAIHIPETTLTAPINPYGHIKAAMKQLLAELQFCAPDRLRIDCLRYFNPLALIPLTASVRIPVATPTTFFHCEPGAVGHRPTL